MINIHLKMNMREILIRGKKIAVPKHYFEDDNPEKEPVLKWEGACTSSILKLAKLLCVPRNPL